MGRKHGMMGELRCLVWLVVLLDGMGTCIGSVSAEVRGQ